MLLASLFLHVGGIGLLLAWQPPAPAPRVPADFAKSGDVKQGFRPIKTIPIALKGNAEGSAVADKAANQPTPAPTPTPPPSPPGGGQFKAPDWRNFVAKGKATINVQWSQWSAKLGDLKLGDLVSRTPSAKPTLPQGDQDYQGDGPGIFTGIKGARSVVFVVLDASGSIGERIQRVKAETLMYLRESERLERFEIIFFSGDAKPRYTCIGGGGRDPKWMPKSDDAHKEIEKALKKVEADGGTLPQEPLIKALSLDPEVVCFLTDGIIEEADLDLTRSPAPM